MAADSGTYDSATLLRRQKIAEAMLADSRKAKPIRHWAEGLAQLADAGVAGYFNNKVDQEAKASRAADMASLAALLGGGTPAPSTPSAPAETSGQLLPAPAPNTAPGKIYSNDEPSPLDPPSGQDRTRMIATILGESANQPAAGQNAVASVIRNRAVAGNYGGDTPSGVVTARNQFEPWNTQGGRDKMAAMAADPRLAAKADEAIALAYGEGGRAPNDPTNGARNFIEPKLQTALGRPMPDWAKAPGVMIGDHKFIGGAPQAQPAPYDVAGPPTAPPQTPIAQAMTPPQMPQGQGGLLANATPQQKAAILAGMQASEGSPARAVAMSMMSQLMKPQEFGFQTQPDGTILRTDPRKGTVEPIYQGATKPNFGIIGEDAEGKKTYGFIDAAKGKVTPLEAAKPNDERPTVTGPDGKEIVIPKGVDVKKFKADVTSATADAATGKKTEVQAKSEKFGNKMELAERNLKDIESEGQSYKGRALEGAPIIGNTAATNWAQSENYQKYQQARNNFITALLRDESGAAIGTPEFNRYEKELFPQPGDGQGVIEQKREARMVAIEGMKKAAGPGYKSPAMAAKVGEAPAGVDAKVWGVMTPEERALWK